MNDGHPTAIRLFDRLLGLLLRPAVRRARRWAFLVTVPAGIALAHFTGLRPPLEDGLLAGAVLALLEIVLFVAVAARGARLLGRERTGALLDLLMHPAVRRVLRGELRVYGVYVRALTRRLRRAPAAPEFAYHRGTSSLAMAIAFLPAMAAEAGVAHLLLPGDWIAVHVAMLVLEVYGALILVGIALGERVHPHELRAASFEARSGVLYRASIPLDAIATVQRRTERDGRRTRLMLDGDCARLAVLGRTDVVLTLREAVMLERPLGDPVAVTRLAVAADDGAALAAALEAAVAGPSRPEPAQRAASERRGAAAWPALGDALDLAGA